MEQLKDALMKAKSYAELLPEGDAKEDIKFDIDVLIQKVELF